MCYIRGEIGQIGSAMNEITLKELQRANKDLFFHLPFLITCDGEPVGLVIDPKRYDIYTRIKDVVEGTSGKPGKRLRKRHKQLKIIGTFDPFGISPDSRTS